MNLALFYSTPRPTLFEKEARRAGFEPESFAFREWRPSLCDKLRNFSLVFVRNCWGFEKEMAEIGAFCKKQKIPLIDTVLYEPFDDSKLEMMEKLAAAGILVPHTAVFKNAMEFSNQKKIPFPLVAKNNLESIANVIRIVERLEDFTGSFADFHFQEYIPASKEYRVMVVGNRTLGAYEVHSRQKILLFPELKNLAISACQLLHFEFASLDVLENKSGQLFLVDINRCPVFRKFSRITGIAVLTEFFDYLAKMTGARLQREA